MAYNHTFRDVKIYIALKLRKLAFSLYETFFPKYYINEALINETIREFQLDAITVKLRKDYDGFSLKETDNAEYLDNMLQWVGADKHIQSNPFFLNPPNVAVIDFLLKQVPRNSRILEYGPGLGNLLIYLKRLGFNNVFGYDNFSQFSETTIKSFLNKFNSSGLILTKQEALHFDTEIAICISYFWSRLDQDLIEKELNNENLEYILLDHYYAPRHIKGFHILGIYKNLLIVFKRKK